MCRPANVYYPESIGEGACVRVPYLSIKTFKKHRAPWSIKIDLSACFGRGQDLFSILPSLWYTKSLLYGIFSFLRHACQFHRTIDASITCASAQQALSAAPAAAWPFLDSRRPADRGPRRVFCRSTRPAGDCAS